MVDRQPWMAYRIRSNYNSNPVERLKRLTRWSILPWSLMSNSKTNPLRSSQEESPMSQDTLPQVSLASPLSMTPSSQLVKLLRTSMKSENVSRKLSSTMSSTPPVNTKHDLMLQRLNGICVNPNPSSCLAQPSNESTTKASKSSWNEPS